MYRRLGLTVSVVSGNALIHLPQNPHQIRVLRFVKAVERSPFDPNLKAPHLATRLKILPKITPAHGEKAYKDPLGRIRQLFERTVLHVKLVSKLVPRESFSTGLPARRCWISMQAHVRFAGPAPRFAGSRFFATRHKPPGIFPQL